MLDITQNISKRLILHNVGKVKSTKPYLPWILVFSEEHDSRKAVMKRERQIKSWKSRKMIEKLLD